MANNDKGTVISEFYTTVNRCIDRLDFPNMNKIIRIAVNLPYRSKYLTTSATWIKLTKMFVKISHICDNVWLGIIPHNFII